MQDVLDLKQNTTKIKNKKKQPTNNNQKYTPNPPFWWREMQGDFSWLWLWPGGYNKTFWNKRCTCPSISGTPHPMLLYKDDGEDAG